MPLNIIESRFFIVVNLDQDEEEEEVAHRPSYITSPNVNTRPESLSFVKVSSTVKDRKSMNLTSNEDQMSENEVDVVVEEEITLRIIRPPGTGLGVSIAGGAGSTPFKDNDEVS